MNFGPKHWLISIAIVIVAVMGWNLASNNQPETPQPAPTSVADTQVGAARATVTINPGNGGNVLSVQDVVAEEGETALDLTKKVADVVTSGEGEMAFVTSIDGRAADSSKNEFWELVINGEPAKVGAGSYTVQDGDKIEWRISTY
ncbi:MAG: hypothetical protein A2Z42_01820 [Candidatus Woykebacteria bacterium RBG_19FT_COMBO_43_10]|uniref:Transcobalamin-like C-terminal domain-containing protein n=1 Tax=Candidatus Woykebacteria bacterium RBG_19FT_COMBO_43_10 TaxID=1802598 RepID=A0A1G1WKQ6_9BACT|nr:MAG: hypothetical protein A2Z42_01820 [Candidatus Woykebacteria bacterium RBG_19FT_COMBO_43_10]